MAVTLSSLAGAGAQFFNDNGVPLAGGLIYTYLAGTTTPAATYTSNTGLTAHANPIVLNAAGRVSTGEIWLTSGIDYKFIIKDASNVQIGSYDNIPSINDLTSIYAALANTTNPALGDALVGFKQSNSSGLLSNAVGRTVHQKLQELVSVKDFGATGNGSTDDTTAIQSAINSVGSTGGGCVYFPTGTYKTTSTLNIIANGIYLLGEGQTASTISCSSASANIITIGNGVTQVNTTYIEKLNLTRSTQYTATSAGVYIDYAAHTKITDVDSQESVYGFRFRHTNNLKIQRCKYVTEIYHATAADSVYGWFFDSNVNTPNASAEMRDCESIFKNYAGTSYGAYIYGDDIKDAFLDSFETSLATYGIWIESTNASGTADFDIHLHRHIHDSFLKEGIVIKSLFNSGSVSIVGGWVAPLDATAIQNLRVENSRGVVVSGMVFFGGLNYPNNIGVYLYSSSSCAITGCTFTGNRTSVKIEDEGLHAISGNTFGNYFGQAADKHINIVNSYRNSITGNTIDGPMNYGIYVDATSLNNNVYSNSINPDAVVTAEIGNLGDISNSIVGADNDKALNKAWGQVLASATPTILGSLNIASVTKTSTGKYTVNFSKALPSGAYAVVINAVTNTSLSSVYTKAVSYTTTKFDIEHFEGGSFADPVQFTFIVVAQNS